LKYKKLIEDKKLGTEVFSPLACGITGKYNKDIPEGSRFDKNIDLAYIFKRYFGEDKKEKTLASLNTFQELAAELECSMAQLAMAWVISNPNVSTAITGATNAEQLV